MNKEVPEDLKQSIGILCETVLYMIKKENNRITRFIVQYNKDDVYIGANKNGTLDTKYYNPTTTDDDYNMRLYVDNEKHCIFELKNHIDKVFQNHKMRSFNIFYIGTTKEINICKNRLGNQGMDRCRLFNKFKMD